MYKCCKMHVGYKRLLDAAHWYDYQRCMRLQKTASHHESLNLLQSQDHFCGSWMERDLDMKFKSEAISIMHRWDRGISRLHYRQMCPHSISSFRPRALRFRLREWSDGYRQPPRSDDPCCSVNFHNPNRISPIRQPKAQQPLYHHPNIVFHQSEKIGSTYFG